MKKSHAGNGQRSTVPTDALIRMHRGILRIRLVEERLLELLRAGGRFLGPLSPSRGQEAVAVATTIHLRDDDWASPTPRELGVHLCRGMPVRELFVHFAGEGALGGRSGAGRLGSAEFHTTPSIGSTASNLAVGAGIALSFKLRRQDRVALGFFGDGVMGTGTCHEVINLAAAHRLPLVMVCNNNGWAGPQAVDTMQPVADLGSRAEAYGLPWRTVDGTDVEAVHDAAGQAVARARAGEGATLIECTTPRLGGFTSDEPMPATVPADGVDVLARLEARLRALGLADDAVFLAVRAAVLAEIDDAVPRVLSPSVQRVADAGSMP